jgi:endonuclease/exonuclease/phosphatase family metal-dependent hydrolase
MAFGAIMGDVMVRTRVCLWFIFFLSSVQSYAGPRLALASYNVENLFDTIHDEGKNDHDYLPGGKAQWTEQKLNLKLIHLARVIRSMNQGKGPDFISLPETENIRVLRMLANQLKDLKYRAYLVEGLDLRGIDVGILTRIPLAAPPKMYRVDRPGDPIWTRPTRPIVEVTLQLGPNTKLGILLNHWPSRNNVEPQRCRAGQLMREIFKSHLVKNPDVEYVALGDFNDEPENISMVQCLGIARAREVQASTPENPRFYNAYFDRNLSKPNRATYYFARNKTWDALDHVIMTRGLLDGKGLRYVKNSFTNIRNATNTLKVPFTKPSGEVLPPGAPIPFTIIAGQDGQLKAVGASDHLPVEAVLELVDQFD